MLDVFNLRPAAIIEKLKLTDVIYADTATYGHFRYGLSTWEFLDCYTELREAVTNMLIEKKNTKDLIPATYNPRKDLKPGDAEYDKLKRSIEQLVM